MIPTQQPEAAQLAAGWLAGAGGCICSSQASAPTRRARSRDQTQGGAQLIKGFVLCIVCRTITPRTANFRSGVAASRDTSLKIQQSFPPCNIMPLKLHFDFFSQPSRACYTFCQLADLPVELAPLRLAKQPHRTPEFKAMSGGFTQARRHIIRELMHCPCSRNGADCPRPGSPLLCDMLRQRLLRPPCRSLCCRTETGA